MVYGTIYNSVNIMLWFHHLPAIREYSPPQAECPHWQWSNNKLLLHWCDLTCSTYDEFLKYEDSWTVRRFLFVK